MDVRRTLKKKRIKPLWIGTAVITTVIAVYGVWNFTPGGYTVAASSLLIGQVTRGDMTVEVRGNGILAPRNVTWIATSVEGTVETVSVKPGSAVEPGQIIAQLVNPELNQAAEELRWELGALQAEHKALQSRQENNLLIAQIAIVEAQQRYQHARLEYDAANILNKRQDGSVPMLVYRRSKLATEQNSQSLAYTRQQLEKLKSVQAGELEASEARISKLKNMLARAEYQVSSLNVKATSAGIVQVVDIEAGQRISMGQSIARVARKDQLIAELKVPERQILDVAPDQPVLISTHLNQFHGRVSRIDPAVIAGTVQVDVEFTDSLPDEARPDLSIEGSVRVASLKNVLHVPRPMYAQSNAPGVVYKLSADGKSAHKVPVVFGKGSASEIAITQGLAANDRIVLSSYQAWEQLDQISITR